MTRSSIVRILILTLPLLFFTGGFPLAQEGHEAADLDELRSEVVEKLRIENEDLKRQLEELNEIVSQLRQRNEEVKDPSNEIKADPLVQQKAKAQEAYDKAVEFLQLQMQELSTQKEKAMKELSEALKKADEQLARAKEQQLQADLQRGDVEAQVNMLSSLLARSPALALSYRPGGGASTGTAPAATPSTGAYATLLAYNLEDRMLSLGDRGLVTLLRFEKVNLCRKTGRHDEAANELRTIIAQSLPEDITNAARWTLTEILQEQRKSQEAIGELEQILTTTRDTRKKKDAIYGIISLVSKDDPIVRLSVIEQMIRRLEDGEVGPMPMGAPGPLMTPGGGMMQAVPGQPGFGQPVAPSPFSPSEEGRPSTRPAPTGLPPGVGVTPGYRLPQAPGRGGAGWPSMPGPGTMPGAGVQPVAPPEVVPLAPPEQVPLAPPEEVPVPAAPPPGGAAPTPPAAR